MEGQNQQNSIPQQPVSQEAIEERVQALLKAEAMTAKEMKNLGGGRPEQVIADSKIPLAAYTTVVEALEEKLRVVKGAQSIAKKRQQEKIEQEQKIKLQNDIKAKIEDLKNQNPVQINLKYKNQSVNFNTAMFPGLEKLVRFLFQDKVYYIDPINEYGHPMANILPNDYITRLIDIASLLGISISNETVVTDLWYNDALLKMILRNIARLLNIT